MVFGCRSALDGPVDAALVQDGGLIKPRVEASAALITSSGKY